MPYFAIISAWVVVYAPKTENFTKFCNINASQGRFPCSISTKRLVCMWSAFPDCLKFGRIVSWDSEVIGV